MQFTKLSTALLALVFAIPSSLAQSTQTLSYDTNYDNANLSLSSVACSDGSNGLESKGYTTLGSLPAFPYVGGAYTVTGWNSTACGTCYAVTYGSNTINVLAVDVSKAGFTVSEEAMNALTNNEAVALGRIDVSALQVNATACKMPA
ncbi:Cerato-platanin [Phlebopus sp. FC_14]|nr:Cerato-platanin [Phlebopus sp. FC_14]